MPVEENKELRDLVTETLKNKGVLGKVQAEIRASVFLALEEQDVFKDKSPFINKPLRDFVKTTEGLTVVSLVREFLEFFNLEFTSTVFEPETHAGIDYSYVGRSKLAKDLMLSVNDKEDKSAPLLSYVVAQLKSATESNGSSCKDSRKDQSPKINKESLDLLNFTPDGSQLNGFANETLDRSRGDWKDDDNNKTCSSETKLDTKPLQPTTNNSKEPTSLTSLSNLPPLGKKVNSPPQKRDDLYNFKSLADFKFGDSNSANNSIQESESEIEEELSNQSNASGLAGNSDNTVDVSLSRASGIGDYVEDV